MKTTCLVLSLIVVLLAGCFREERDGNNQGKGAVHFSKLDLAEYKELEFANGLLRFSISNPLRFGYANTNGDVVLKPQYYECSLTFTEGYAWVDLGYDDDVIPDSSSQPYGDFIDTNGVRLVGKRLWTPVSDPWLWRDNSEPQFVNGLAFVSSDPSEFPDIAMPTNVHPKIREIIERKSARYVYCIDTNGNPVSAHTIHGPFYTRATWHNGPRFRQKSRLTWVDLLNGDRGILLLDGTMALTTSVKDYEKLHEIERQFVEAHFGTNAYTGEAGKCFYH
jgi:hypothetical protein